MHKTDSQSEIPEPRIREELERILAHSSFLQSERLSRFLRFTVDAVLAGNSDTLKEYVIGTEVYDRRPPYHPSQDSIVRTEARRLRAKLREYYDSEGKSDEVLIYYRPGGYAPVFRLRTSAPTGSEPELFMDGRGISIAVVPFESNAGDKASATCAVAVTDELIHGLMRTEGCRVTSAGAAAQQAQRSDLPELAKKLGIHVFFEGSVRQEGSQLRVTARLIGADGFQLWSQRFEIEPQPDQIFAVSEDIARSLISRVRPQLSGIRHLRISAGTGIFNIYPTVLAAEALVDEGSAADVALAILRFKDVIQGQPKYPRPLCGIAQGYYELALQGVGISAATISEAKESAQRAIALDPELVPAHSSFAALSMLEWNLDAAEESFDRAMELGTSPGTFRQFAAFLCVHQRFDEAWSYLQRANGLDPFSYRYKIACARYFLLSRRYAEIQEAFPQRQVYGPVPLEARLYLALVYLELGRAEEAKAIAREARHYSGFEAAIAATVAEILVRSGESGAANDLVRDLALLSPATGISRFRQSLLSVALGDQNGALAFLTTAHENREPELIWVHSEPRLESLRRHPEFLALAQKVPPLAS